MRGCSALRQPRCYPISGRILLPCRIRYWIAVWKYPKLLIPASFTVLLWWLLAEDESCGGLPTQRKQNSRIYTLLPSLYCDLGDGYTVQQNWVLCILFFFSLPSFFLYSMLLHLTSLQFQRLAVQKLTGLLW